MTTDDALAELASAVEADDWEACDAWACARSDDEYLGVAAGAVGEAMERERARRERSLEEGTGDGLTSPQRRLFEGIVHLWRVARAGGPTREVGADRDAAYGVLVDGERRLVLAVSCARPTIVIGDASESTSPRATLQLFRVLGALAYVTSDAANLGRSFDLRVGSIAPVSLLAGSAPRLASRWYVEPPERLAPWCAGVDAVSVRPAGGRLGLAPYVVQLEQEMQRLVLSERFAIDRAAEGLPSRDASVPTLARFNPLLDKLDLLLAWGWAADVEPLRPVTAEVVASLEAGRPVSEIVARIREEAAKLS